MERKHQDYRWLSLSVWIVLLCSAAFLVWLHVFFKSHVPSLCHHLTHVRRLRIRWVWQATMTRQYNGCARRTDLKARMIWRRNLVRGKATSLHPAGHVMSPPKNIARAGKDIQHVNHLFVSILTYRL
jgi:hypothetical protein